MSLLFHVAFGVGIVVGVAAFYKLDAPLASTLVLGVIGTQVALFIGGLVAALKKG